MVSSEAPESRIRDVGSIQMAAISTSTAVESWLLKYRWPNERHLMGQPTSRPDRGDRSKCPPPVLRSGFPRDLAIGIEVSSSEDGIKSDDPSRVG